jgi:hypothetical protein
MPDPAQPLQRRCVRRHEEPGEGKARWFSSAVIVRQLSPCAARLKISRTIALTTREGVQVPFCERPSDSLRRAGRAAKLNVLQIRWFLGGKLLLSAAGRLHAVEAQKCGNKSRLEESQHR